MILGRSLPMASSYAAPGGTLSAYVAATRCLSFPVPFSATRGLRTQLQFHPSTVLHLGGTTAPLLFPSRVIALPRFPRSLCAASVHRPPRLGYVSATVNPAAADVDETAEQVSEAGEGEQFDWYAQWYPLFPLCDLDKRVPHAITILGLDLVVWWDRAQESWQVFEDRCPHRLAPLSEGRIDQWGRLQCVYHGWCFDGQGSCKLIPQAPPEGPPIHTSKKACVAVYPSLVQNKILWFWPNAHPSQKDIAMAKKPPYIPEIDDPTFASSMGIRDIPYGYEVLTENLMDPAHVPYAHYGLMGLTKKKGTKSQDREGGRPLDLNVQTLSIDGYVASQENGISLFTAPCLFYFRTKIGSSGTSNSSSGNAEKDSPAGPKQGKMLVLVFYCIPVSPGKSRVIWSFPRNFAVWMDNIIPRWMLHIGQNLIIDSDLYLLHVEEKKIVEIGHLNWQKAVFVPTKSDGLVVGYRKWLKRYANGQVDWKNKFGQDLPPSPPRELLMDRYRTHVLQCRSCSVAVKGLNALEVSLQVVSVALIALVAAAKQNAMSTIARYMVVSAAILCFICSRWLSSFIFKTFHYHDYNHALIFK